MRRRGFSLVEVMMVLAVLGVLLGLALSSYTTTIANTRTRSTAEAILAGLQLARSEAIRRNAPMRFQFVNNFLSTCTYAANVTNWIVTQTDQVAKGLVNGACHAQPWTPPDQVDPCTPAPTNRVASTPAVACADDPWIAYRSDGTGFATELNVAAQKSVSDTDGAMIVTFGPLGQVLTNIGGAAANPSLGFVMISHARVTDAKRWGVSINTVNGNLRLCEPDKAAGQPMACT